MASASRDSGYAVCDETDHIKLECGQGAPSLDKAVELAGIYHISLDDLAGKQC